MIELFSLTNCHKCSPKRPEKVALLSKNPNPVIKKLIHGKNIYLTDTGKLSVINGIFSEINILNYTLSDFRWQGITDLLIQPHTPVPNIYSDKIILRRIINYISSDL